THLGKMGIKCGILEDGLVIEGKSELNGGDFGLFHNREIALAFYLAALTGHGKSTFENFEIINDNYPDFVVMMENIAGRRNHF
ncbi:MAG: hypothetical protein NTV06_07820, partial [candidate division Zixibacteria bacterium]|nr:hypothetical protein [candidate division Zixibacteria bacterium]